MKIQEFQSKQIQFLGSIWGNLTPTPKHTQPSYFQVNHQTQPKLMSHADKVTILVKGFDNVRAIGIDDGGQLR